MPARSVVPVRLRIAVGLLALVSISSVCAYVAIERWSWFDALYMTVATMTTVGGEPHPLTTRGRWLTLGVIVLGVGATSYTFLATASYVLEGQLGLEFGRRRTRNRVRTMNDHFILCGFGRVGREIAREFVAERVPFVVIDVNQTSLADAVRAEYLTVSGNATSAEVLREAGIERARGLVTATDNDADNVYVTLSARVLRPELFIVARANRDDSAENLKFAGADRIISPYYIGGKRMASLAMRPTAVDFIDTILEAGNTDLLLEDLTIPANSRWAGKTLGELVGSGSEAMVLALKRANLMTFRPANETVLHAGDEVVAAGPRPTIRALEKRL
ncbi:MAG: potassium channel protein [Vulcanimicrobiaceae bacterium]